MTIFISYMTRNKKIYYSYLCVKYCWKDQQKSKCEDKYLIGSETKLFKFKILQFYCLHYKGLFYTKEGIYYQWWQLCLIITQKVIKYNLKSLEIKIGCIGGGVEVLCVYKAIWVGYDFIHHTIERIIMREFQSHEICLQAFVNNKSFLVKWNVIANINAYIPLFNHLLMYPFSIQELKWKKSNGWIFCWIKFMIGHWRLLKKLNLKLNFKICI